MVALQPKVHIQFMIAPFAVSSPEQALALAVAIERHNARRFHEWGLRFRAYDLEVSQFLEELEQEEYEHERELVGLFQELFGERSIPDYPVADLERYTRGLAELNRHFLVADSETARRLLKTAREIERYTREFYVKLLDQADDPRQQHVFQRLAAFEDAHEEAFRQRLEQQSLPGS